MVMVSCMSHVQQFGMVNSNLRLNNLFLKQKLDLDYFDFRTTDKGKVFLEGFIMQLIITWPCSITVELLVIAIGEELLVLEKNRITLLHA